MSRWKQFLMPLSIVLVLTLTQAAVGQPTRADRIRNAVKFNADELRGLTILFDGITFAELFGSRGLSLNEVNTKIQANWRYYRDDLNKPDVGNLNFDGIEKALALLDAELGQNGKDAVKNTKFRDLYTKDLGSIYSGGGRTPNKDFGPLFTALNALDAYSGGNVEIAILNLDFISPPGRYGNRDQVELILSPEWCGTDAAAGGVGNLTFYDLSTRTYDDPTLTGEQRDRIFVAVNSGILRSFKPVTYAPFIEEPGRDATPTGIVMLSGGGGVDCCCQNPSPDGKKKCFGDPDLGCTNTGTPSRCSLGSIACPAGTACP